MSPTKKPRITKAQQKPAAAAMKKEGKPYKGTNFIAPKEASAKKNAHKAASARKATKAGK